MYARTNESCRTMFRRLGILTFYSQYIFSTIMFVVKNKEIFTSNASIHNIDTRRKLDLHVPSVKLTKIQKVVYYCGIILFNALPIIIKNMAHNIKKFEARDEKIYFRQIFLFCKGISWLWNAIMKWSDLDNRWKVVSCWRCLKWS